MPVDIPMNSHDRAWQNDSCLSSLAFLFSARHDDDGSPEFVPSDAWPEDSERMQAHTARPVDIMDFVRSRLGERQPPEATHGQTGPHMAPH